MKPRMINLKPQVTETQNTIKNLQEKIVSSSKELNQNQGISSDFINNLEKAVQNVSDNQKKSAEITKSFELGFENDLTKVMIQQQLASLGFQMTLNVRNKVLSAYKDIMNMPV